METMNAQQIVSFTGLTRPTVVSRKERLAAAGANVPGSGKEWQVEVKHLIAAELVQPDGTPFPPKPPRRKRGTAPIKVSESTINALVERLEQARKERIAAEKALAPLAKKYDELQSIEAQFKEAKREFDRTQRFEAALEAKIDEVREAAIREAEEQAAKAQAVIESLKRVKKEVRER
jgi:DNA repair exonuclease SbcCD ATPase subunit